MDNDHQSVNPKPCWLWGCLGFSCGCLSLGAVIAAGLALAIAVMSKSCSDWRQTLETTPFCMGGPESFSEEYVPGDWPRPGRTGGPKIAVIDISGIIVSSGAPFAELVKAPDVCARIQQAAADPAVKALIVNLNTPGGEVTAADTIYEAIRRFREQTHKPAVAMMNAMAASGGYYVAAACKPIIAARSTLTGSIGVIISVCNYRGLFDKIGLSREVYASGKMKDLLNGARVRTPEEIAVVRELVNSVYSDFVRIVSRSRGIPEEAIRSSVIGDGRIFDGKQALRLGLVDSLGYFRDAVTAAAKAANIEGKSYTVVRYQAPFNFASLVSFFNSQAGSVKVSLPGGGDVCGGFTLRPGMLYFLPADF